MYTKGFLAGTLVGGIALHAVGYLIWGVVFTGFFAANAGSATGVPRDSQLVWAVALGNLSLAALMTLAVGTRAGSPTITEGARIGAIVGFLAWFGVDFILYGTTNNATLKATIVDPLLELIHAGIAGAVIAAVLRRVAPSVGRETRPA